MPTYIYQCNQDEDHQPRTEIHSMAVIDTDDEPKFPCPNCGGPTHRVPQIPAGIGRSPFDVYVEFSRQKREELKRKKDRRKALQKARQRAAMAKTAARKARHKSIVRR